jgi:hypothetical protein
VLARRFRKLFVRMEALADGVEMPDTSNKVKIDEVSVLPLRKNRALINLVQARFEVAIVRVGHPRSKNGLPGSSVCVPTPSNGMLFVPRQNLPAIRPAAECRYICKTAGVLCAERGNVGCRFSSWIPQRSPAYKGRETRKEQSSGVRQTTARWRLIPVVSSSS